ncbi:hypothetical protein [Thalassomonas haliotis]|nr:hypothetical protein [Thalassomonas haliotis]
MNIFYQNKYIGAIAGVIDKAESMAFLPEILQEEINPDLIK